MLGRIRQSRLRPVWATPDRLGGCSCRARRAAVSSRHARQGRDDAAGAAARGRRGGAHPRGRLACRPGRGRRGTAAPARPDTCRSRPARRALEDACRRSSTSSSSCSRTTRSTTSSGCCRSRSAAAARRRAAARRAARRSTRTPTPAARRSAPPRADGLPAPRPPGPGLEPSHVSCDNGRNDGFVRAERAVAMWFWDQQRPAGHLRAGEHLPGRRPLLRLVPGPDLPQPALPAWPGPPAA